jgi:glycosyltransferase involved in cell wall biosynthesis
MPKLLRTCSVLVIPYSASHLSQVPLSAVEALSAGVPCIIASGLALAFDVKNAAAGEIFENPEEFNQAFQTIKASYNTYCESARGMAERYFDARKNLSALSSLYTLLERHEI